MKKIIIVVLALAVVLGFLFWKFSPNFLERGGENVNKPISLTVNALWEEESLIRPAIDEYKKQHPNVAINYKFQSSTNYRSRIQTQLNSGEAGDIVLIHNSWLPMFLNGNQLAAMPEGVMSLDEYSKTFNPVVLNSFSKNGQVFAVPRGIDTLVMFYNEEMVKGIGGVVPQSWDQFIDAAKRATVVDAQGEMKTAGAALGMTGNVDHWSDIIGLLYYQNGADPAKADSDLGAEVLKFYTSFFNNPDYKVWDSTFPASTQAFSENRVAFYFGPSWRAHELRVRNPALKFGIAKVPQLPGKNVNWATFWGYGVSAKSANPKAAWEFLKFLTSAEAEKLLYQEASKVRLFGLPYSMVDLQGSISQDPMVGAVVAEIPTAKSWYLSSNTFDKGINDNIIKYYEDAINQVNQGQDVKTVLQTTQKGIDDELANYSRPAILPSPKK